jgi:hypothetical protein
MTRTYRYVAWEWLDDYFRLGWCFSFALPPHHAEYGCACEWLCACPMMEPKEPYHEGRMDR